MRSRDAGSLIYGNSLIGLVHAIVVGRDAAPMPAWFSAPAIEKRLAE
jgi:hypothetical protein